jgi:hypothetical protein
MTVVLQPYAFLFGIKRLEEAEAGNYGIPAYRPLFENVLRADPEGGARFGAFTGDVLLHNLAYKIGSVAFEGKTTRHGFTGTTRTMRGDPALYQTIIWDFCDSLSEGWTTADLETLADHLFAWDVFAVAISHVEHDLVASVDTGLQSVDAYLGSFSVDTGNPIQLGATAGCLPHHFDYWDRSLIFDPLRSEDPFDPPPLTRHGDEWWVGLPFKAVRYVREEERRPAAWPRSALSDRGALSAQILARRGGAGHLERVAESLDRLRVEPGMPTFEVDVGAMPGASDAVIEERKLTEYVLNPQHEDGRHKARLFRELLGIGQQDWRYLADQIKRGLSTAETLDRVRSESSGVKYHALLAVRGLNGAVKPVLTAWEVRPREAPRLTTAYVAGKGIDAGGLAPPPPDLRVASDLKETERWEGLWRIANEAGSEAGRTVIPTPMRVGREWVPEGAFGSAWITVPDVRTGFARWLVKADRAHVEHRRGAVVSTPYFAVERARAYAEAFSAALRANGIRCTTSSRLD